MIRRRRDKVLRDLYFLEAGFGAERAIRRARRKLRRLNRKVGL